MKKTLLAAGLLAAALAATTTANAAVMFNFDGGLASPGVGYTVIDQFNDGSNITSSTGTGYIIQTVNNSNGAPPANSNPLGTNYLSVLGGGSITYSFANPTFAFQFDWGSVDDYNFLEIYQEGGLTTNFSGSSVSVTPASYGDQGSNFTNGLFTVKATDGAKITGFKMSSGTNSFEIDNLAVGVVPEPSTWAVMILGFASVGAVLRRRRTGLAAV